MKGKDEWIIMSQYMHQIRLFSRISSSHQFKQTLTSSEIELLSWLFVENKGVTPMSLAHKMGMKKVSISRLVKTLSEKELVIKQKSKEDERSYYLTLSPKGQNELDENYKALLLPLYHLKQNMETEAFLNFMNHMKQANDILQTFYTKGAISDEIL